MITPLLATKFFAPGTSSRRVERQRLTQRLDAGLQGKLTLVCAPRPRRGCHSGEAVGERHDLLGNRAAHRAVGIERRFVAWPGPASMHRPRSRRRGCRHSCPARQPGCEHVRHRRQAALAPDDRHPPDDGEPENANPTRPREPRRARLSGHGRRAAPAHRRRRTSLQRRRRSRRCDARHRAAAPPPAFQPVRNTGSPRRSAHRRSGARRPARTTAVGAAREADPRHVRERCCSCRPPRRRSARAFADHRQA